MMIRHLVARWPGSSHGAFIWENSSIRDSLHEKHEGLLTGVILGDFGYPMRTYRYILKPFNPDRTPAELRYNEAHPATRVCVERTFGLLKSRYLTTSYQLNPDGWIKFVLQERKIARRRMNAKYTTVGP